MLYQCKSLGTLVTKHKLKPDTLAETHSKTLALSGGGTTGGGDWSRDVATDLAADSADKDASA